MSIPFSNEKSNWEIENGDHVFRIYAVEHDEDLGQIALHLVTCEGKRLTKRIYYLLKDRSGYNNTGLNQIGNITEACMPGYDKASVDPYDIEGLYFGARVYKTKPNENGVSYTDIKNFYPAKRFEEDKPLNTRAMVLDEADMSPVLEKTKKERALARRQENQNVRLEATKNNDTSNLINKF